MEFRFARPDTWGEPDAETVQITDLAATRTRLDSVITGATTNLHTGQPCPAAGPSGTSATR
ncbi:hypothetical protein [Streptomyces sp. NPDC058297]|uniref:hypothetical protein n=1 Tax=Streptomyces sp. NPDC058297 TaxID=3346433 RepID=UPI0036E0A02B